MAFAISTPTASGSRSAGRRSAAAGLSSSRTSPTCRSRIQEKDELRHLNDRLANYIQRVQDLESERSSLLFKLEEKDECKSREMGNVRRLYEEELADVRKSLDGLAGEKARLQIDYGNMCEDYMNLQARNQKKESDLANTLTQWRKVEAALVAKDAESAKLLSDNNRLRVDLDDLQGQMEKVESSLSDAKNQLSSEILRRVDMENQVQTLKETLDLHRNISEQEMLDVRSKHESCMVELESVRRKDFESKLAKSLQQLRQDHDSQLQQCKEELDKTYSSKLQNVQQAAQAKNDAASATQEELVSTKLRMETLLSQLHQYQNEKMALEGRFHELERTLDKEREGWQQKLNQKEQEMLKMSSQMYNQLEEYQSLLDVKLALDVEINAYRKMLEVEEERLQLSPSPPQSAAIPRMHEHSGRKFRGKKRKHEGASGSSPADKMFTRPMEHVAVTLSEDGKYVQLKNLSSAEQQLGGWVVRRTYRDTGDISFHLPPSCILSEGQTLTIWAAGAEAEADPEDLVLDGHGSWGPISDVRVILLNPELEEVAESRVCMQRRGGEPELEFVEEKNIQHFRRQLKPKRKRKCCSVS